MSELALQVQVVFSPPLQTQQHFQGSVLPGWQTCECVFSLIKWCCLDMQHICVPPNQEKLDFRWRLLPVLTQVKLLGIDASGIADGVPSVVLNLIWNIILYFQAGFLFPHHPSHSRVRVLFQFMPSWLSSSLTLQTLLLFYPDPGKGCDERPPEAFVL